MPGPDRAIYALALTALRSLCQLLTGATHFNFRNNIIDVIAPIMTGRFGADMAKIAQQAARTVFKEDLTNDAWYAHVPA